MLLRYLEKEILLAPLTVAQDKEMLTEVTKIFTPKRGD
jgi:hypothetical protein